MNPFIPIGVCAAIFLLIGGITWGWAGAYAIVALVPSVIIGGTISHFFSARRGIVPLRPGLLAIGVVLGSITTIFSGGIYMAATDNPQTHIQEVWVVEGSVEEVWSLTGDPERFPRWNSFVTSAEPIGATNPLKSGGRYQVALNFDGRKAPAELTVTEIKPGQLHVASFQFPPGTELNNFTQTLSLQAKKKGQVEVTYTLRYDVPSVMGRLFNAFVIRGMFKEHARFSGDTLRKALNE
jgi:uncharacterized protein YndB with AHSA1/START domain